MGERKISALDPEANSTPKLNPIFRIIIGILIGVGIALNVAIYFRLALYPDLKRGVFFIVSGSVGCFLGFLLAGGMGRSGVKGWLLGLSTYAVCMFVANISVLVTAAFFEMEWTGLLNVLFLSGIGVIILITGDETIFGPVGFIIIQLLAVLLHCKWSNNPSIDEVVK